MKKTVLFLLAVMALGACDPTDRTPAPKGLKNPSILAAYGRHPLIVSAVRAENAGGLTLERIKEADRLWVESGARNDLSARILASPCSNYLRRLQAAGPYFSEIFVMDRLGAVAAMTAPTTDYYQGDEAKFIRAYNDGKGDVFVDRAGHDESSKTFQIQISVPVIDGNTVIGAMTFGIDVDRVD
ncbi:hypothetical protein JCM14469_22400 [Desulfatiferula olefinivorans]